jgi:hypothetical protein
MWQRRLRNCQLSLWSIFFGWLNTVRAIFTFLSCLMESGLCTSIYCKFVSSNDKEISYTVDTSSSAKISMFHIPCFPSAFSPYKATKSTMRYLGWFLQSHCVPVTVNYVAVSVLISFRFLLSSILVLAPMRWSLFYMIDLVVMSRVPILIRLSFKYMLG